MLSMARQHSAAGRSYYHPQSDVHEACFVAETKLGPPLQVWVAVVVQFLMLSFSS